MAVKNEKIKSELAPPMEVAAKEDLSEFKIKDKHFNKIKTYISKKDSTEKEIEADWRNININGLQMAVKKGQPLAKKQYRAFGSSDSDSNEMKAKREKQKDYWLDAVKTTKEVTIPEGVPDDKWTKPQLIALAKRDFPDLEYANNVKVKDLLSKIVEAKG